MSEILMNNLPLTNKELWFNCTTTIALTLPYKEFFILSIDNRIVHGYGNKGIGLEGIKIIWEDNPFKICDDTDGNDCYILKTPSKPKTNG